LRLALGFDFDGRARLAFVVEAPRKSRSLNNVSGFVKRRQRLFGKVGLLPSDHFPAPSVQAPRAYYRSSNHRSGLDYA
jgi:hypothetical protein